MPCCAPWLRFPLSEMERQEYCDRVLAVMRRPTGDERRAIREELDGHMEDRIEVLLELGYEEQLAEERALAAMGSPEEVGRALDREYPRVWLILSRIAVAITTAMCIAAVFGVGILFHTWNSLVARIAPEEQNPGNFTAEISEKADIRVPVGNDVLRVYQVSTGTRKVLSEGSGEEDRILPVAEVLLCAYDRIPGGIVSGEIEQGLTLYNARGEALGDWSKGGGGAGSYGAEYMRRYTQIEMGDTYVLLVYDRFGEQVSLEIPLPEVTP